MNRPLKELIDFCLEKKNRCEYLALHHHAKIYDDIAQCLVALAYYQVAEEKEKVNIKP